MSEKSKQSLLPTQPNLGDDIDFDEGFDRLTGETEEPDNKQSEQLVQKMLSELQNAVRQTIGEVVIEKHAILEGQLLAKIKDSRGQTYLVLKRRGPGFDKLGGKHADAINAEKAESTFNWLRGKKIADFYDQSVYLENAMASKKEVG